MSKHPADHKRDAACEPKSGIEAFDHVAPAAEGDPAPEPHDHCPDVTPERFAEAAGELAGLLSGNVPDARCGLLALADVVRFVVQHGLACQHAGAGTTFRAGPPEAMDRESLKHALRSISETKPHAVKAAGFDWGSLLAALAPLAMELIQKLINRK